MTRLDEIEARANAATPGPWRMDRPWAIEGPPPDTGRRGRLEPAGVVTGCNDGEIDVRDEDLDFICAARGDVPWLVARVRKLEAALRGVVDGYEVLGGSVGDVSGEAMAAAETALEEAGGPDPETERLRARVMELERERRGSLILFAVLVHRNGGPIVLREREMLEVDPRNAVVMTFDPVALGFDRKVTISVEEP